MSGSSELDLIALHAGLTLRDVKGIDGPEDAVPLFFHNGTPSSGQLYDLANLWGASCRVFFRFGLPACRPGEAEGCKGRQVGLSYRSWGARYVAAKRGFHLLCA